MCDVRRTIRNWRGAYLMGHQLIARRDRTGYCQKRPRAKADHPQESGGACTSCGNALVWLAGKNVGRFAERRDGS